MLQRLETWEMFNQFLVKLDYLNRMQVFIAYKLRKLVGQIYRFQPSAAVFTNLNRQQYTNTVFNWSSRVTLRALCFSAATHGWYA